MNPYDVFLITQPFPSPFDVLLTVQGGGAPVASDRVIQLITLWSMTGE